MTLKINKKQSLSALLILFSGVFSQAVWSEDTSDKYFSIGYDGGSYAIDFDGSGNNSGTIENDNNKSYHLGLGYELSSNLALEFRYRGIETAANFSSAGSNIPASVLADLNSEANSDDKRVDSGQVLARFSFPIQENVIPYIMGGVNKYEGSAPVGGVARIGINLFGSNTTALNFEGGVVLTKDRQGGVDTLTFDKSYGFGIQHYFGGDHK